MRTQVGGGDRIQPCKFFLGFLTTAEPDKIGDLIKQYEAERKSIKKQLTDVCYHMNGGVTRTEAWLMSPEEREEAINYINRIIEEKEEALTGKRFM